MPDTATRDYFFKDNIITNAYDVSEAACHQTDSYDVGFVEPIFLTPLPFDYYCQANFVDNQIAYTATYLNGIIATDISDPAAPLPIGSISSSSPINSIIKTQDYIFILQQDSASFIRPVVREVP